MRYFALACDYDGTLALHGKIDEPTRAALQRVRESGRKLLMVTGRELDDLQRVCPFLDLFHLIVAENGALLYTPATREEKVLGERPSQRFVQALMQRGVEPLSVGRVIVATWEPHEVAVMETIHELGLEMQVIFNKGAVMVLPSGINKATGLHAALDQLALSTHNTVGVGDAENDHAFLSVCEFSAAVANALPALKERADWVTPKDHGAGVTQLIDELVENDLQLLSSRVQRHRVLIGADRQKQEEYMPTSGLSVMLAGSSGSGKSTLATGLLERLKNQGYQFCVIDPEGDYSTFEGAVVLGDPKGAPGVDELLELLETPTQNAVVNLVGISLGHRPQFFEGLLPHLQSLRVRTGRPHWLLVDETHHLLPTTWDPAEMALPFEMRNMIFVTVHPESVSPAVLSSVDLLIAVGDHPDATIRAFCEALSEEPPRVEPVKLESGEVLAWWRDPRHEPKWLRIAPPRSERRRHSRKYAEGDLGPDRSFYFRGPDSRLNLQAQNLMLFLQMAEGVDDETWLFHLRRGDYSTWFREKIKDPNMADEARPIETQDDAAADATRKQIRELIEKHYTLPA